MYMKQLSFFLFVATGLILCISLSAQQYHDAAAFGLKGHVKECKVVYAESGSATEDPHGFASLSFSKEGKLEDIIIEAYQSEYTRKITNIERSEGMLTGFNQTFAVSLGGDMYVDDYLLNFHYKGGRLIGLYVDNEHGRIDKSGNLGYYSIVYQVYTFAESGKDSFNRGFFAVADIVPTGEFMALIEDGFDKGEDLLPKLETYAVESDDLDYGQYNSLSTKYIIKERDSHGNYTILTDEDGESIKRIITYWDDEPASARISQSTSKPSAAPTPKPAITEKTPGLRPATPKELSVQDLITRPFGVLSQNSKKLPREQILFDLSDYGWKAVIDDVTGSVKVTKDGGYDMPFLGVVPSHAVASFSTGGKELTGFLSTFYFKNNPKEAQRFANILMEHLRSEGVDLPNPKKNAKKVSVRHGDSKVEVLLPNGKDYFGLVVHYQGLIKTDGKEEFGWFESIESGVSSFKLSDSRE